MKSHEDLDVWRLAVDSATDVYEVTGDYPNDEKFGLVSQMRRAAVSVATNIAEGAARNTDREFTQFLYVASGSASELATQSRSPAGLASGMNQKSKKCETPLIASHGCCRG